MPGISHEEAVALVLEIAPKTCIQHRVIMDSAVQALVSGSEPAYQMARYLLDIESQYERKEALALQRQLLEQVDESNRHAAAVVKTQQRSARTQERVADAVTGSPPDKLSPEPS